MVGRLLAALTLTNCTHGVAVDDDVVPSDASVSELTASTRVLRSSTTVVT
jgi:hypothetical protein